MSDTEVKRRDDLNEIEIFNLHRAEWQLFIAQHPEVQSGEVNLWHANGYWTLDATHKDDLEKRKNRRVALEKAVEKQYAPKAPVKSIVPKRASNGVSTDTPKQVAPVKRGVGRPKGATVAPAVRQPVNGENRCRCGCDKLIPKTGKKGRPAAYLEGHRPAK